MATAALSAQKNDLLLTEGGDPGKLGRGTLWADELSESIHQNHVFRVRREFAEGYGHLLDLAAWKPVRESLLFAIRKANDRHSVD